MPYVTELEREVLVKYGSTAGNVGGLTFQLTELVTEYLSRHPESFSRFGEAVAALECAKLELYRRVVAPYEDKKCEENGDVY